MSPRSRPERDRCLRLGNLNHFNAPRLEGPQPFVLRIRFAGEQQRADRLGAGTGNGLQERFHTDSMRQVDQNRPILQLDPTAVGGTEAVGEAGQVDPGRDLLHEIQSSGRTAPRGHEETSDQGAESRLKHPSFLPVSAFP